MLCHLGLHKLMGGPLVLKRVQYNMWFLRRGVWDWLTPGPASAVGGGLGVLVPLAPGPACALVPLVAQLAWLRRSASRDEEAPASAEECDSEESGRGGNEEEREEHNEHGQDAAERDCSDEGSEGSSEEEEEEAAGEGSVHSGSEALVAKACNLWGSGALLTTSTVAAAAAATARPDVSLVGGFRALLVALDTRASEASGAMAGTPRCSTSCRPWARCVPPAGMTWRRTYCRRYCTCVHPVRPPSLN